MSPLNCERVISYCFPDIGEQLINLNEVYMSSFLTKKLDKDYRNLGCFR